MKRKNSAGYFSSYDRGLECLLDLWPEIRKQVPGATLDVYYGWDTFDRIYVGNSVRMKWKYTMIRKLFDLKDEGVTEHGRVSHEELAKAMLELQVWAYPTEFTEINCITALKAQQAGMIPVVTKVAALAETVKNGYFITHNDIYTNKKAQEEFVAAIVKAFKDKTPILPVPNVDWSDIAEQWDEVCAPAV